LAGLNEEYRYENSQFVVWTGGDRSHFSIYLTLAVVFIAQATNTPLSLHDLALVLLVSVATVVIAFWERDIDSARARAALNGKTMEELNGVSAHELASF
jgi:Na+/H+-dicarboxylate symporter